MRANLIGLVVFQRTGVGLAAGQADFRQYVKNLTALYFHLSREIVDTNLTHPPLFKLCFPWPLVAHSYLMPMAVFENSIVARLVLKDAHLMRCPLCPPVHPILRFLFLPIQCPASPHHPLWERFRRQVLPR